MSHQSIKSEISKQHIPDDSSSDIHSSIDYQGLAQESAAVAAAAATSRQQQQQQNNQQLRTPQEQQQQQLSELQQLNQPNFQIHNETEPNTPTTEIESSNDVEGGEQDSNHVDNIKNPHRIKLSSQDVKLILYLIVETKPFKYVGDRSLSQTKKWDIIQKKYFNIKFKELQHKNFVVPTVRTLQRQLAAGVKKAQSQRNKDDIIHPIPPTLDEIDKDDYYNFRDITVLSPQNELESALYDLHELSNKIKSLKMQSNSLIKVNYQPRSKPPTTTTTKKSNSLQDINGKEINNENKDLSLQFEEISNLILDKFTTLKDNQQINIKKSEDIFNLLESIFQHSNDLRNYINEENDTLSTTINQLFESHLNKIEYIKKEYNLKQIEYTEKLIDILTNESFNSEEDRQILANKINSLKDILNV
ncbi:uncharacterized protein KGF55_002022 [Candida pseudojiufengensis]|uniref:uncharacterized protein n=1 Tax=Candida pseudojiufengensis TaxID=497109 RepID=UPI002225812B|nr:uncharacterized protein KGF55_002022 [Candida pseudojiufengensis]KAI5964080.1 hypothetical protein KGF55_002022 [Candida pseudojiufengensis]